MKKLTKLNDLFCGDNQIKKIKNINSLINLEKLCLENNQIEEIEGINNLINLKELSLSNNHVKQIKNLEEFINLEVLMLDGNEIRNIENLDTLVNLEYLDLSDNNIQEFTNMNVLIKIKELFIYDNSITIIPLTIMNLAELHHFRYDDDKIELNPIIQRFINRNKVKSNLQIYDDDQNVHDTTISKSLSDSIYKIMQDKLNIDEDDTINEIVDDKVLKKLTKKSLIDYSEIKDIHTKLNVTFKEVLLNVWNIIRAHENSKEIKRILNEEMKASLCKCFTGRLARLVNSLNGFDERVQIQISDNQELANIIILIIISLI